MPRRARKACMRCRQQKLRCDNERPCALCVRSCIQCEEAVEPCKKRPRRASYNDAAPVVAQEIRAKQSTESPVNHHRTPASVSSQSKTSEWHTNVPSLHQDRSSTYGLVDQLFHNYESTSNLLTESDALPDATPDQSSSVANNETFTKVSDLIGHDLPPPDVVRMLFDVFIHSVHWFMLAFHEPTVRAELERMITTGRIQHNKLQFVILIVVVLATGIRYATEDDIASRCPGVDLKAWDSKLRKLMESKFLDALDSDNYRSVQICILMSSLYIYHRQPKRCFIVHGAAIKAAQAMSLHRESAWNNLDIVSREERRRAWWALYVSDGFGAITFGSTPTIQDGLCAVGLPSNIDDADSCPGFGSSELLEDGSYQTVTTLTYQRLKFKLYRIAAPITRDIYFHRAQPLQDVIKRVKEINQQLVEWERTVPPELRPGSFPAQIDDPNPTLRIFRLQALVLQLSYDNMQLILHRPLLVHYGMIQNVDNENDNQNAAQTDFDIDFFTASREQCWESAKRISHIDEYNEILRLAQNSHGAGYSGIQVFTAGVMLAIFALSNPFSIRAQEAKRGIGRLIKVLKVLGSNTPISNQSGRILQELLRLILGEEMKMLTSDQENSNGSSTLQTNRGTESSYTGSRFPLPQDNQVQQDTLGSSDPLSESEYSSQLRGGNYLTTTNMNTFPYLDQDMTHRDNFSNALLSVQQGMHCVNPFFGFAFFLVVSPNEDDKFWCADKS